MKLESTRPHADAIQIHGWRDSRSFCHLNSNQLWKAYCKGRHKRESKNAKQMRNTKQNCFSHSSASPRNDKQCSAKQCFANQTNRCLAGFASRSDLFRDNARLTKHRRKVNQRHLILQAMYTTMWLQIYCWLAVSHMFRLNMILESSNVFLDSEWRRR